jgi:hypothetical protein
MFCASDIKRFVGACLPTPPLRELIGSLIKGMY